MTELRKQYLEIIVLKHINNLSEKELKQLIVDLLMNKQRRVEFVTEFCNTREEMAHILGISTRQYHRYMTKYNIEKKK